MPTTDEKLKFKHHFQKLRCHLVVFADFECFTEELKEPEVDEIKTYNHQEHKPCGFMFKLVNAVLILAQNFAIEEMMPLMHCVIKNKNRRWNKRKNARNKEIEMTDEGKKKILKLLLTALYVKTSYKMEKEAGKYKKVRDYAPQATLLINIKRSAALSFYR